jgi:hypothetical protein
VRARTFEKREIDKSLFRDYKVTSISQLGKKIAERASEVGEPVARNEFKERSVKAVGDNTGVAPDETEVLVGTIFRRLYSIGIASII